MNPRRFLLWLGITLLGLGALGFLGLGPTAIQSILGSWLWLDTGMRLLLLVLGAIALITYGFAPRITLQRGVIAVIGFLALAAAIIGFMYAKYPMPNLGFTNIENPVENIVYLLIAAMCLWVAFMPEGPMFIKDDKTAPSAS